MPSASDNPYRSPDAPLEQQKVAPPASTEAEVVSTVIPYKNPQALIAYYLGLFSIAGLIPLLGVIGVLMAIAAVILGVRGLRFARVNDHARGRVHAWVGILCGGLFGVLGLLMQVGMVLALLSDS